MSIYKDIIHWTADKPLFIQDAIRRLLSIDNLTDSDISELVLILKKEIGFRGISNEAVAPSESDISAAVIPSTQYARLTSIRNPININALFDKAKIEFSQNGLTVVYGGNGSGKSSYSRILKKICWSRQRAIDLKPNVYENSSDEQEVELMYDLDGESKSYSWKPEALSSIDLNSIFVFDSKCADVYLNSENPTEYKPVGTDILERLIEACRKVEDTIDSEINQLTIGKPELERSKFKDAEWLKWYDGIEKIKKEEVESQILFSDKEMSRKTELQTLLKSADPVAENKLLSQKSARYKTVLSSIKAIEQFCTQENLNKHKVIKDNFVKKHNAFKLAKEVQKGNDPLEGVGSDTWKAMWLAAREFATKEVHPTIKEFPGDKSSQTCVLCQQELNSDAKKRLERFDAFIKDKTSTEFSTAKQVLNEIIQLIESQQITRTDTFDEIEVEITTFKSHLETFEKNLLETKSHQLDFLRNKKEELAISTLGNDLSKLISDRIEFINKKILKNNGLLENRSTYSKELLELEALQFLNSKKDDLLKYIDEYNLKEWLNKCKSKTKTTVISKKIGSVLESDSIALQHEEFKSHLTELNPKLAGKILIKKTKTANGATYQKCGFAEVKHSIPSILSEGEQKVVALANFLSECTIDNAKNTIVFDDPVTSLDQDYREAIAAKTVTLSSDRQVIVFTHDLYFVRLLMDLHKAKFNTVCALVGLKQYNGVSGIVSDEIPYLARNVQARVDTITISLNEIRATDISDTDKVERLLDSTRQRMRKLLEKSIEDILINRTIQRFSKNISAKRGSLASLIVVEKSDTDFLLSMFGKYSVTEHDGSIETLPLQPDESTIRQDLTDFKTWKDRFVQRVKNYKNTNNYN
jgi:energy-coupling factor transporter ATP-binding protein EcfA2